MCNELLNNKEYTNYQTGEKLDLEQLYILPDNAMLKVRPELWCEWDFEKNNELGFDIWKMTKGSGKKTWWICKNNHSWIIKTNHRSYMKSNCPYCAGQKVNSSNSLATKNPQLASEWHPTLNGELSPNDVTCGTSKKVWWLGTCGHEWETSIVGRNRGTGCPYCSKYKPKLLVGFNDMWTTNPDLASLLANPEDGYKYMQSSEKKVNWKCECGTMVANKMISNINKQGLSCPNCSDGFSYPEKFMSNFLTSLNISFENEKCFDWSENKRYDFYIPSLNMIIEIHGGQHYSNEFKVKKKRTLLEEVQNDTYKRDIATRNGIANYIEIDAQKSDMNYIKDSIINCDISNLFDLTPVNWENIDSNSRKTMFHKVIKLWNDGIHYDRIPELLPIHISTVYRYLRRGHQLDMCVYTPKSNPILQLDRDFKIIKRHDSVSSIKNDFQIKSISSIYACCTGKYQQYKGFRWMYLKDYEVHLSNQNNKIG